METMIVTLAAGVVCSMCILLVMNPEYDDGLIGRAALSVLGIAGVARFMGGCEALIAGHDLIMTNVGTVHWTATAAFLSRHAWRFMHYKGLDGHRRRKVAK